VSCQSLPSVFSPLSKINKIYIVHVTYFKYMQYILDLCQVVEWFALLLHIAAGEEGPGSILDQKVAMVLVSPFHMIYCNCFLPNSSVVTILPLDV
jgi:hypothetical protein